MLNPELENPMKTITILVLTLGMTVMALNAEPPTVPSSPKKAEEVKSLPTLDAREAAEIAAKLKESIQGSPEKLAKETQRLVRQVQAELEYGKPIAVLDTHIRLLEEFRVECRLRAEETNKERKATGKELEDELARLKSQYKENPEIAEQAQVDLIVAYRTTLRALKAEEECCLKQTAETTRHLLALRMNKAQLEEKRKLDVKEVIRSSDLVLPPLPTLLLPAKASANPGAARESLKDALDSLKDLTK